LTTQNLTILSTEHLCDNHSKCNTVDSLHTKSVKTWQDRIDKAKKLGHFSPDDHSVPPPEEELRLPSPGWLFGPRFAMGFAWQGVFKTDAVEACEYIYGQMVKISKESDKEKQEQIVTETWKEINVAIQRTKKVEASK